MDNKIRQTSERGYHIDDEPSNLNSNQISNSNINERNERINSNNVNSVHTNNQNEIKENENSNRTVNTNSNGESNGNHNNRQLEYPTFQAVEQNTSYTRRRNNEEDERFFKLAKEAIVHTANATKIHQHVVDPTLNDLFTRLQYLSSPHGNPIKSGENIKVNDNGQLMIHEFYNSFPNFNNNIFQNPPRSNNGLIGENPLSHLNSNRDHQNHIQLPTPIPNQAPSINNLVTNPVPPITSIHKNNNNSNTNISGLPNQLSNIAIPNGIDDKSDERRYECPKCFMNFKRSSDLKRHEKQHLTIPPNICQFCGKGFARKDALKRHIGTATCKRNAEKKLYIDNLEFLK